MNNLSKEVSNNNSFLQFEELDYQKKCVDNIIEILRNYDFKNPTQNELQKGLKNFYINSNCTIPVELQQKISSNHYLDVLMETGTGKTYTYLKTIFELHSRYNQNKFILFLPRVSIVEGAMHFIKQARQHFRNIYKQEIIIYRSDPASIKQYINSTDNISLLVITNSSIDKKNNKINQETGDLFAGEYTILKGLTKINPIIIFDEPHLLKGEKFLESMKDFQSLIIRFGATYPKENTNALQNVAYVLDSKSAFQNYLVKKINIIHAKKTYNDELFYIKSINSKEKQIEVSFQYGNILSTIIKIGDDIGSKIFNSNYNGVTLTKITKKAVFFSNGTEREISKNIPKLELPTTLEDTSNEVSIMIDTTINKHFEIEEENFTHNIKTLSLFFIQNIDDYDNNDRTSIKQIFEHQYKTKLEKVKQKLKKEIKNTNNNDIKNSKQKYLEYLYKDVVENNLYVNKSYFSNTEDKEVIDLILKDKKQLLSFKNQTRFIFSVFALQEGWDNPNIFNICKISQTKSETSIRQQVGRGLRICVNQQGSRITKTYCDNSRQSLDFYKFNTLNMIVSSKESNFIAELQSEIDASCYGMVSQIGDNINRDMILKQYKDLSTREVDKFLKLLEDNNIIEKIPSTDIYKVLDDVYGFLYTEKAKSLGNDLLGIFKEIYKKPSDNKEKQIEQNESKKTNIRKDLLQYFKEMWELINTQADIIYNNIEEDQIIDSIAKEFNEIDITENTICMVQQSLNPQTNQIEVKEIIASQKYILSTKYISSEIMQMYKQNYVKYSIPLQFYIKLFKKINLRTFVKNPEQAKKELIRLIVSNIENSIIHVVDYKFTNTKAITSLHNNSDYLDKIEITKLGRSYTNEDVPNNYLYDDIVFDSNLERKISQNKEELKNIKVFAKLPRIYISTPFKKYNPDFAYVVETRTETETKQTIFLVIETKGYDTQSEISNIEKLKMSFAKKFFEQLQSYCDEKNLNVTIQYKKVLNINDFTNILTSLAPKK